MEDCVRDREVSDRGGDARRSFPMASSRIAKNEFKPKVSVGRDGSKSMVFESKKEKKRRRLILNDSDSDHDLSSPEKIDASDDHKADFVNNKRIKVSSRISASREMEERSGIGVLGVPDRQQMVGIGNREVDQRAKLLSNKHVNRDARAFPKKHGDIRAFLHRGTDSPGHEKIQNPKRKEDNFFVAEKKSRMEIDNGVRIERNNVISEMENSKESLSVVSEGLGNCREGTTKGESIEPSDQNGHKCVKSIRVKFVSGKTKTYSSPLCDPKDNHSSTSINVKDNPIFSGKSPTLLSERPYDLKVKIHSSPFKPELKQGDVCVNLVKSVAQTEKNIRGNVNPFSVKERESGPFERDQKGNQKIGKRDTIPLLVKREQGSSPLEMDQQSNQKFKKGDVVPISIKKEQQSGRFQREVKINQKMGERHAVPLAIKKEQGSCPYERQQKIDQKIGKRGAVPFSVKKDRESALGERVQKTNQRIGEKHVFPPSVEMEGECGPVERKQKSDQKLGKREQKQALRDRIIGMLLSAGWKVELRPRSSRKYEDPVYVSPTGSVYWSIPNAYYALMNRLNGENGSIDMKSPTSPNDMKSPGCGSSMSGAVHIEELSILKRKTNKTRKRLRRRDDGEQATGSKVLSNIVHSMKAKGGKSGRVAKGGAKNKNQVNFAKDKAMAGGVKENGFLGLNSKGVHKNQTSGKFQFLKPGQSLSKGIKDGKIHNMDFRRLGEGNISKQKSNKMLGSHKLSKTMSFPKLHSSLGSHLMQGQKKKNSRGCALMVRNPKKGANLNPEEVFVPYKGKRTIVSWLVDSGVVLQDQKVQYWNKRHTKVLLNGWITRDGILCGCCDKILTVSQFEVHAGSKPRTPFQNTYLGSGKSLLQCQLEAWDTQSEHERREVHIVKVDESDTNDDTCGICGDGGDLLCCDGCPSTYHQCCLAIKALPSGDWHCPNCLCRFCGANGGEGNQLLSCGQCEMKLHHECAQERIATSSCFDGPLNSFCSQDCMQLYGCLCDLLGVPNDLGGGFSWTLLQRCGGEREPLSGLGVAHRTECNSKIAIASSIMDECFYPIIDQRSSINMIHNILYNCGSNFNRLNYSGFYTIVLEKAEEIISAASIRIHGTKLAEMPLIGTRHIYRRQGMCRRLVNVVESVLRSLNVEKLIIPAISELLHTWREGFGFKPLEESHRKELRTMNMMVFPGTDLLQKQLLKHGPGNGKSTDTTATEFKYNQQDMSEIVNKSQDASSAESELHPSTPGGALDGFEVISRSLEFAPICSIIHTYCDSIESDVVDMNHKVSDQSIEPNVVQLNLKDSVEAKDASVESHSISQVTNSSIGADAVGLSHKDSDSSSEAGVVELNHKDFDSFSGTGVAELNCEDSHGARAIGSHASEVINGSASVDDVTVAELACDQNNTSEVEMKSRDVSSTVSILHESAEATAT
ncbi:hypothetical protein AMTRI_Chr03g148950 [Amborella trichopoda]